MSRGRLELARMTRRKRLPVREILGGLLASATMLAGHGLAGLALPLAAFYGLASWLGWVLAVGTDVYPEDYPPPEKDSAMLLADSLRVFQDEIATLVGRIQQADALIPSDRLSQLLDRLADGALAFSASVSGNSLAQARRFAGDVLRETAELAEEHARLVQLQADQPVAQALEGHLNDVITTLDSVTARLRRQESLDAGVRLSLFSQRLSSYRKDPVPVSSNSSEEPSP